MRKELTVAERRTFEKLLTNLANKEIARELNISIYTVRLHSCRIYKKLGVRDRIDLLTRFVPIAHEVENANSVPYRLLAFGSLHRKARETHCDA